MSYGDVNIAEVRELIELENLHAESKLPLDLSEFLNGSDGALHLDELRGASARLREIFKPSGIPSPEMARVLRTLGRNIAKPEFTTAVDELLERASQDGHSSGSCSSEALRQQREKRLDCLGLFRQPNCQFSAASFKNMTRAGVGCSASLFKRRRIRGKRQFRPALSSAYFGREAIQTPAGPPRSAQHLYCDSRFDW